MLRRVETYSHGHLPDRAVRRPDRLSKEFRGLTLLSRSLVFGVQPEPIRRVSLQNQSYPCKAKYRIRRQE